MSTGFVVFRLADHSFATPLDDVREIVRLSGLERLPGAAPPLAGVLVLRGSPLPVLDVRGPGAPDDRGDVLVVASGIDGARADTEGLDTVGIAVDAVLAVLHPEELPPAGAPSRALPAYVVGVRQGPAGPMLLVDLQLLLATSSAGEGDAPGAPLWKAGLPALTG